MPCARRPRDVCAVRQRDDGGADRAHAQGERAHRISGRRPRGGSVRARSRRGFRRAGSASRRRDLDESRSRAACKSERASHGVPHVHDRQHGAVRTAARRCARERRLRGDASGHDAQDHPHGAAAHPPPAHCQRAHHRQGGRDLRAVGGGVRRVHDESGCVAAASVSGAAFRPSGRRALAGAGG